MIFKYAQRDENYDVLKLASEGGEWELGLRSMLYGVRVRLGRVGECYVCLDYCAGADRLFQLDLLNAVRIILLEDIEDMPLESMFPRFVTKPINLDEHCWLKLQEMRDDVRQRLRIADEYLPIVDQAQAA